MINAIYQIGKNVAGEKLDKDIFIQNICLKLDSENISKVKQHVVILNFNTETKKIEFDFEEINAGGKDSGKEYLWVGNNPGRKDQIYFITDNPIYLFTKTLPNIKKRVEGSLKTDIEDILSVFFITIYMIGITVGNVTVNAFIGLIIGIIFAFLLFGFDIIFRRFNLRAFNIAIIGLNNQVKELIYELKKKPHLGYNIVFVIDDKANSKEINSVPIYSNISALPELIAKKNIDNLILLTNPYQSDELRSSLFKCLPLKINFISLPNFYENITGKVPIEAINQMWFLENLTEGKKSWFDFVKRLYDIVFACIFLIIILPFWPIIGLIIKLESKGPIFFLSKRTGKNNKAFYLIKFRTMKEENNNRTITTHNDPRITKFGRLLRKIRIDEFTQMINILKGEMSFVGPRPERPELIKELEKNIPFYRERMLVKPGATGWDQISGEYHSPTKEDTLKKLQYDLFYIKNRSIYLDLSIILKTIATVLSEGGR